MGQAGTSRVQTHLPVLVLGSLGPHGRLRAHKSKHWHLELKQSGLSSSPASSRLGGLLQRELGGGT